MSNFQLVPRVPKWSPDGQLIAYWGSDTNPHHTLSVISPAGGEPRVLVHFDPSVSYIFPRWSRDGRRVYYKTLEADGASRLWRVPIAAAERHSAQPACSGDLGIARKKAVVANG